MWSMMKMKLIFISAVNSTSGLKVIMLAVRCFG